MTTGKDISRNIHSRVIFLFVTLSQQRQHSFLCFLLACVYLWCGFASIHLHEKKVLRRHLWYYSCAVSASTGSLTWQPIREQEKKKILCGLFGWWHLNNFNQLAWLAKKKPTYQPNLTGQMIPFALARITEMLKMGISALIKTSAVTCPALFSLIKQFLLNAGITRV